MKYFKFLLIASLTILTTYACQSGSEDEMNPPDKCSTIVSYSNTIRPLIDQKCGNCHLDGSQAPDLTNYETIKANASKIKSLTQSGIMPKEGSLTQTQKDAIACWVDNGALNN